VAYVDGIGLLERVFFLSFITLLRIRGMFRGNILNMLSAGRLLARFPGGHRANSLMSMLSVQRPESVEARCGGG